MKNLLNKLRICVIWGILLLSIPLLSQQSIELEHILGLPNTPEERIDLAEVFLTTQQNNDSIAYLYNQFAYWLYDYDLKKTIHFEEKARSVGVTKNSDDILFLQKNSIALGFYYQKDLKYLDAIAAYRDVVLLNNQNENAIKAYNKLGFCYDKIYNYPKAIKNYTLVTTLLDKKNIHSKLKRDAHYNIASIALKINTKEALQDGIEHIKMQILWLCISQLKRTDSIE